MLSDHAAGKARASEGSRDRPVITDPEVLAALAHPVRLDLLGYLMSAGPATASACARAVGDTPSNCSYHLRTLAGAGLVEREDSGGGREGPRRPAVTGYEPGDESSPEAGELRAVSVQHDQR